MTERFNRQVEIIFRHEGGYVNDPNDPGGETKFGISKRSYPGLDIKNLSKEKAKEIYWNDFYQKMKIGHIADEDISLQMFDFGVNAGGNAVKTMQNILNLKPDGVIGNDTLNAVNSYPDQAKLHNLFVDARVQYYKTLVEKRPASTKYLDGWLNRVFSTTSKKKIVMISGGFVLVVSLLTIGGLWLHSRMKRIME